MFEDALQAFPSARMFEVYAKFLTDILDAETLGTDSLDMVNPNRHEVARILCQLYERALSAGISSEPLAKGHLEFLIRIGELGEALNVARKSCDMNQSKNSAILWEWRISLEMNRNTAAAPNDQDRDLAVRREIVLSLFREAVKCVPLTEAKRLWLMVSSPFLSLHLGTESHEVNWFMEFIESPCWAKLL